MEAVKNTLVGLPSSYPLVFLGAIVVLIIIIVYLVMRKKEPAAGKKKVAVVKSENDTVDSLIDEIHAKQKK